MTLLKRVEKLEAALLQVRNDVGYKLVMLEEGESCEEGRIRAGLKDWPAGRIIAIRFVSADD